MTVNAHHRRALRVLLAAVILDMFLGSLFSAVQGTSVWEGLYYATGTATTVGADITPRGTWPHVITVIMMITVIPLFAAVFSLLTAGLTADHVDKRHEELKKHITEAADA